jgi:hypothetical protein
MIKSIKNLLEKNRKRSFKEKLTSLPRSFKKGFKLMGKKGILKKAVIIICALALIATSVLPFIF